ncbi:MAG TPA: Crp/Fnr family transcriptional regulator [Methylophilaceae bacterium]|nr:Crp/Fnr family transcriptional regulator [Methylophilaceae bacterium]
MSSTNAPSPINTLIDSLPSKDRQHLIAGCEQVELVFGEVIYHPGEKIRHVYFPTDSFISLVMPIQGGASLEVGLVGNEGMYGVPIILGVDISPFQSVIQGAGPAMRMDVPAFLRELDQNAALLRKLKRYTYVKMRQLAQTAACNRFHLVEQRLARWLLMTHDRAHSDEFNITQAFLSQMLGVRRVGVTKAAGSLQNKKLISYTRGAMKIHDVIGLEAESCSCYRADKENYAHIMRH